MNRKYIFVYLLFSLLSACVTPSGEKFFVDNPRIVSETNTYDRVFTLQNDEVWERRWSGTNWMWVSHGALNAQISSQMLAPQFNDLALGPLLCNLNESICRLYILVQHQTFIQGADGNFERRPRTRWFIYNFNPFENDYSTFQNFNVGPFSPLELSDNVFCSSNLAFDNDFNLYCIRATELANSTTINSLLYKYDLDLNFIGFSDGIKASEDSANAIGLQMRPCVISESDIFYANRTMMNHVDEVLTRTTHVSGSKNPIDVSQSNGNQCQVWSRSEKVWGRRFSQNTNSWQWDDNDRPIRRGLIQDFGEGSMRATPEGRLYLLIKHRDTNTRVYERYPENGGWFWVDHGFPDGEVVSEIGWVRNGQYFVTTRSGNLYQRQWRGDLNRWAWQNHGQQ